MDKETILSHITKSFQSVMDFFNIHESHMEEMVKDLHQEACQLHGVIDPADLVAGEGSEGGEDAKN